ncbi:1-acyl-sn-glycerol-3-phosphate acyltransferase [Parasphingorhabdus sp. DH2-15]|uniref:1-acyl-sn-glycerol-3-phosphate acyltransferase n=1 Tax=Parasphingorhabdus sp. DH2-15 TaxID=3444112 RepID=UPI003F68441B
MSSQKSDFTVPGEPPMGFLARMVFRLLVFIYRCHKFTAIGEKPAFPKFIIIAVPHTSNWDFPNYVGLTRELGLRTRFMAKSSLFKWPMTRFMAQVGGVPVERDSTRDMVQQMADKIAQSKEFILTIAPEGTRSASTRWRTGFYHIAMAANIPIVCGFMDYGSRRAGLGPVIHPTGDYEKDMAPAFAFYEGMTGLRGEGLKS